MLGDRGLARPPAGAAGPARGPWTIYDIGSFYYHKHIYIYICIYTYILDLYILLLLVLL